MTVVLLASGSTGDDDAAGNKWFLDGRGNPQDEGETTVEKLNTWMLEHIVALQSIARDEEGQDFAEYALIFALIVVVAAVALGPLGTKILTAFQDVKAQF